MLSQRMVPMVFGLVVLLSFFLPGRLLAYNEDGRIHFEASVEGLERDIEEENAVFLGEIFPKERTSAQSLRLLGKLSIRLIDAIEIYGVAGGSDLELDNFDFSSDFSGAYGGGARFIIFQETSPEMPFHIFADYRFLRFKAKDTTFFLPTVPVDTNGDGIEDASVPIPAGNAGELVDEKIQWNEHVLKFGVMGRHDMFEPYGGIRFSIVRGKDQIPSRFQELNLDFKQSDTFGIFFGTSYYLGRSDKAAVFIEASLFDQNSLAGGVRVGF
jgi:hypothetical protein